MNCPDCLDEMVQHQHRDWPKRTFHCACGIVAYYSHPRVGEGPVAVLLEDPLEDDMAGLGIPIPVYGVNSPQMAHRHRPSEGTLP